MLKKGLSIVLCLLMVATMFPAAAIAGDVQQNLPINDGMESVSGIAGVPPGAACLTQDRVSGRYAVKVTLGDNPSANYFSYKLTTSTTFDIYKFTQIKIWVKPGAGAKWIRFWNIYDSNTLGYLMNDKDGDGYFEVGQDLISGKWSLVTLDLTKTSNPGMVQGKELWVHTNEFSTWIYDEITSVYAPASSVDISKIVNSQTEMVNGELRFKPNSGGSFLPNTYNTIPTVLVSNNTPQAIFSRSSVAYNQDGTMVGSGVPRYETGTFNQGVMIEEGTTNLLTANQSNIETDLTGWSGELITRDTYMKWEGSASLKVVTAIEGDRYVEAPQINVSANTTYTYSAYLNIPTPVTSPGAGLRVVEWTSGGAYVTEHTTLIATSTSGWKRFSDTFTTSATTGKITLRLNVGSTGTYYWDGIQLEQKAYATSWQIGGTARAAEILTIPTAGMFNKGNWAVELTFKPKVVQTTTQQILFYLRIDDNNRYVIWVENDKKIKARAVSGGIVYDIAGIDDILTDTNYSIMFAGNGSVIRLSVNGSQVGNDLSYTEPVGTLPNYAYVGSDCNGVRQFNGIIDNLRISSRARTLAEHQAAYNSNQPLPIDQYTTCKIDFDGSLAVCAGHLAPALPSGRISRISIDSSYATTSGSLNALPSQKLYLSGIYPSKYTISGDGNRIIYAHPGDGNRLYLLDLNTGEYRKISDYVPAEFKTNFDGTRVAFKITGTMDQTIREDDLYLYNDSNRTTTFISHWVQDFDIQKDGSVAYIYTYIYWDNNISSHHYQYRVNYYTLSTTPSDTTCLSGEKLGTSPPPGILHVSLENNQIFYNDYTKLYVLSMTPAGWRSNLLTTTNKNIDGLWVNKDGTLVFIKTADGFFSYYVSSKALRKLDLTANNVIRVTDDNKLAVQGLNAESQLYDTTTDTVKNIRPQDAVDWNFDINDSGMKMVYTSSSGLSTSYPNGVQRSERYLFSFDGKNSWYSYKDGAWIVVKTDAVPVEADFTKYGMTIDEVNALDEGDFAALYADGREILHFDVAVYFASVDAFTTPSLKGIKVILNGGENELGELVLEKALYTTKQQDFTATKWRKIRRIYPVEIFPKEAEAYYLTVKDGVYQAYRNGGWTSFDGQLLNDVETNWITITQQGMTAEELRAIPEISLNALLPATNFSIIYAMKVQDLSTAGYSSLITVDYVENLFDSSALTLTIKYLDGTSANYSGLTKAEVEGFMEWVSERQYNRGPIFYCLKTISGGVEVNDFINYYSIKSVAVNDSVP